MFNLELYNITYSELSCHSAVGAMLKYHAIREYVCTLSNGVNYSNDPQEHPYVSIFYFYLIKFINLPHEYTEITVLLLYSLTVKLIL